ncbi:FecR family protein [Thalassospira sp.]|uniref:FecR family protein n=1 Tax=Thalassospira sp. TaxID=1912094 RepID=UPI00273343AE|nr:FecR family protein [Thalassospira sp.]MDP2697546.1 FecR family protein [Thalassospira sp.]
MKRHTDPIRDKASKEATGWLILLQEDPDDMEVAQQFQDWCNASPAHLVAWEETRHAAGLMAQGVPRHAGRWQPFLSASRDAVAHPVASNDNRRGWRRVLGGLAIAASLLVAVMAGPGIVIDFQADYSTQTAETRAIVLADQSVVMLAPQSAIRVRFEGGERQIDLLRGEAFFEVTPDERHPFRVSSDSIDVTVLGTGFDVRRGENGTDVAVEHGLVRVDMEDGEAPLADMLTAGQRARVSWAGDVVRDDVPDGQIATWRHQQLIAQDQPLSTVIDGLRRYYPGTILITDAALARRPVTGVYHLADPLAALRGIARAQNAVIRQVTPWVILVSAS